MTTRPAGRRAGRLAGIGLALATAAAVLIAPGAPSRIPATDASNVAMVSMARTPAGEVTVLTSNAEELLYSVDLNETADIVRLGQRIQQVVSGAAAGHAYAPDVVLLQEVTQAGVGVIATSLRQATGYDYRIAANAAAGKRAWEPGHGWADGKAPYRMRDTAVIFNADTMTRVSNRGGMLMTYPASAIPDGVSKRTWIYQRQNAVRLSSQATGQVYLATSVHLRHQGMVTNKDAWDRTWVNQLKQWAHDRYPGAVPIFGGDFNDRDDVYPRTFRTPTTAGPGAYHVAQPKGQHTSDGIASLAPGIAGAWDQDYKTWSASSGYFPSSTDFSRCDNAYNHGVGMKPRTATTPNGGLDIPGCASRFYSDHQFVWATFGSPVG